MARPFKDDQIFHITVNGRRTSFSLDNYLSDLLAIRLDREPRTQAAHKVIRKYLTTALRNDVAFDPELPLSRQARHKAIRAISDETLVEKYTQWFLEE